MDGSPPTTRNIASEEAAIEAEFDAIPDFTARAARLVALGRAMPTLPEALCTEETRVAGCQSLVWVVVEAEPSSGCLRVRAKSDSALMRGLLALVVRLYDGRPAPEIAAHDPAVVDRLLTGRSLAPSRANGLHLVVKRIREAARAAMQEDAS